ncbi:DUF4920 domain-containing protein [Algoriphagus formosus]|uniref:DUF4920 domain-containing protein n=1 Tax=Algoriphagus formosus TaxID=2007308 RepID=A0A4R5UUW3_9BACT|nr:MULTISPECIES: DUF4920 domain-containing protein [Algoriphagus]TDK42826.1 DUF4920 domain-containing protein [Algoriphagus aquimaris]
MMKKSLLVSILAVSVSFYSCQKSENSESHHDSEGHHGEEMHHEAEESAEAVIGVAEVVPGMYGAAIAESDAIALADLVPVVEEKGTYEGKIIGEIKEVCTKKGCWLTMDLPNGESMRVTFKDYGFFVPTNSQGFPIVLEGVATFTETDVETLKHFAEDQGKSQEEIDAIVAPKKEITFEAIGVVIMDKA